MDEASLRDGLSRLDERYLKAFSRDQIITHVKNLLELSSQEPVRVLLGQRRDGTVDCTVIAFDYPYEFSLITGILAGTGFNILSGDVFTFDQGLERFVGEGIVRELTPHPSAEGLEQRRRIVDHFTGVLDRPDSFPVWASSFKEKMREILGLLEQGGEGTAEARNRTLEMVVKRFAAPDRKGDAVLYPVQIEIDNEAGPFTLLKVRSQDTPAFLYALSNAISRQDVLIMHVRIRTVHGNAIDELDIADLGGKRIADPGALNRIQFSVLLTKHFTHFLGKAPDPYAALSRFDYLLKDMIEMPEKGKWFDLLANPYTLQGLARLLGTSDLLWEDFVRTQYESILPMLAGSGERYRFSEPTETLETRLVQELEKGETLEEKTEILNRFKDHELFLIDLDHILSREREFQSLSEGLTVLAECVVRSATDMVFGSLAQRFGIPRTAGGLEVPYAIMGLGKLGGAALGYASDTELLYVYSDSGRTDGVASIENAEFFDHLVKGVIDAVWAKRQGIFHIDVRLRPFGGAGPLACSLESFCRYYEKGGKAHSYERLALVRLRAIGGDPALGARLERIRDQILYANDSVDFQEIGELRKRQLKEKATSKEINAKFCQGGLVDLEYTVQILQVKHGQTIRELRTPRMHKALSVLTDRGILSRKEGTSLLGAYDFFRDLINGMRMLRGSAEDLYLPPGGSQEFRHLARRMGYKSQDPFEAGQRLYMDLEIHRSVVKGFAQRYMSGRPLPESNTMTIADLALLDTITPEAGREFFRKNGFKFPERAYRNIKRLAGQGAQRDIFAKTSLLFWDILGTMPDADMALNNWERFVHALASPESHFRQLLSQPIRMEMMLCIFSGSQFLSDTLVRNPGFLEWVMTPELLHQRRRRDDLDNELSRMAKVSASHRQWLNRLRRMKRREILRIGTRDMFLKMPTREVMTELSVLADAFVQAVIERMVCEQGVEVGGIGEQFCVMAMGKLGGSELNYSSDIDLLALWGGSPELRGERSSVRSPRNMASLSMERIRGDLSSHTEEGYAYRVDLRLRPFGRGGILINSEDALLKYYTHSASLWEILAAIKMRPVAGDVAFGYKFLEKLRPSLLRPRTREEIVRTIERMRRSAVQRLHDGRYQGRNIKSGLGGLRDIEFLVQGLQLVHAPRAPAILEGNTLNALDMLQVLGILPEGAASQLKDDYLFLRRIEHQLQIMEDLQVHSLPRDKDKLDTLAKRLLGYGADGNELTGFLEDLLARTHRSYRKYLIETQRT